MRRLAPPIVWGVGLAIVGLGLMIAFAERMRADVLRSAESVSHTLDVQKAFNLVLKDVLDAETGQRGFLLTASPAHLAPYHQAQASIGAHLESLRQVTASDDHHRQRVGELVQATAEKMADLQQKLDLAERGDRAGALAMVKTDRGRLAMERVRALIDSAFIDEQKELRRRQAALTEATRRRTLLMYVFAAVSAAALGVVAYLRMRLDRLEPLVTLCAWSRTVQDGDEWISFEEYLRRRFGLRVTHGLSPEEFAKLEQQIAPPSSG